MGTQLYSIANAAKWVEVSNSPKDMITYLDTDSVRPYGTNSFTAWSKWLYKKADYMAGKRIWFINALDVYDCMNSRNRTDSAYTYGMNGQVIASYTREDYEKRAGLGFTDIVPETFQESMKNAVCKTETLKARPESY